MASNAPEAMKSRVISQADYGRILPMKTAMENKLLALQGVTGVDVGLKTVRGKATATPCILIFVAKKGTFPAGQEIPKEVGGVATDIVEATFTHYRSTAPAPQADTNRYDPCQGGSSIAPARFNNMAGTLGMLVTDTSSGSKVWLSNYHVMCVDGNWSNPGVDRSITQPAIADGGNEAQDTIGQVLRGTYGQVVVPWGYDLYVDAAVCSTAGRNTSPNVIRIGAPKGAANASMSELVTKYGRTTERTTGVVVSTNFTVIVDGTTFYYQYRVGPPFPGDAPFSQPGDSGAAVFDTNFNVIGIVMAGSGSYTTVNPIGQIMDALKISVP